MPKQPLYPHVPGKREPLFPHVPKSRQVAGKVTRLPQTEKGKYAWWILDPETGEIMIKEGFTTPEEAKISAKAYAIRRARWVAVLPKRVVELRIYDSPPDIEHFEIGIVFKGHILTPEGKIVEVPEHPLPQTLPQTGTCYADAWRFLIKEEEGELIHGSVQTIGKRINHAWVETETGFVWEPESGEFMKKSYFYERAQPQVEAIERERVIAEHYGFLDTLYLDNAEEMGTNPLSEKIQMMEGLLDLLADLFNMTTTQVAKLLMSEDIRSWDDFAREVRLRRR